MQLNAARPLIKKGDLQARIKKGRCILRRGKVINFLRCGFCLVLLPQLAAAKLPVQQPPLRVAPANPAFVAWQDKVATFGFETYSEQGRALGHVPAPFDRSHLRSQAKSEQLLLSEPPSSYDLRLSGHVTSVKSQGNCGSCWTFGTYGSLESWLLKNEAQAWDLSENHLKNEHGFDFTPCEGGNTDMSTAYLARWSGPVDELDDPYHDWDDRPSPGGTCQKYLKSALWFFTESDIKNAIMTYGAMYSSLYWDSAYYNSSEYAYYYSGSNNTNHGVTIIGWDDNKIVSGAPGDGAWLIKNSWGTSWGDEGYFWISYYDSQAVEYAMAFCNAVPTSSYANNYQYDPLGWTNSIGYSSSIAWAANIFTAAADEGLTAVALYAVDNNVSYEIYIYDNFDGSTFSGLMGSTSGTLINSGYYTISLPLVIDLTSGDDFSIVVKFTTTGYGYPIPVEEYYVNYSSEATANPGESYVSSNNGSTFTDITNSFPNTNVCIKGLTIPPTAISPAITSTPVTVATVGELYNYDVDASGCPSPTYSLTTYPSGMTIDPNTGLIEWTLGATGDFDVDVKAGNGQPPDANQAFTVTVSEPPPYVDNAANADITVQGSVSGSYTDTQSSNDGYEAITEVREGNPGQGYSSLQHKWTINVIGGDTVTFYVEAYQTASSDGDNFVFAYSTDDSTYTDMLTVTKTSDDDAWQSYELPDSLSSTVYIRVIDTDSGAANQNMDTVYVDHIYIRSTSSDPITYTLTVNTISNGYVTAEPNQPTYTSGTEVELTAMPDTGYHFVEWSNDLTGSTNPDTITMNSNKNVTANFAIDTFTLDYAAGAGGTLTGDVAQVVDYDTDGTIVTAVPNTGYHFVKWSDDVMTASRTDLNVMANINVAATFAIEQIVIFGYITEPDVNIPIESVIVSTDSDGNSITDANGYYQLTVDYGWSGTVDPNKTDYTFEPNGIEYNNVTADQNDNYTAILDTFAISGYAVDSEMLIPLEGVLVTPDNNGGPFTGKYYGGSDTTDANGYYEVLVDCNWAGKVVPFKYAYAFEPNSITYADVTEDKVEGQDYVGTLLTYTITGCIENSCEVPTEGALVDANNGGGSDMTEANGCYEVWVDYNWSGTVTPAKANYTFDPNSNAYTNVLDDVTNMDYTATNIYDLDCDGFISFSDVGIMCENWLDIGPNLPGDFYKDEDNTVNFLDFADFANALQN